MVATTPHGQGDRSDLAASREELGHRSRRPQFAIGEVHRSRLEVRFYAVTRKTIPFEGGESWSHCRLVRSPDANRG